MHENILEGIKQDRLKITDDVEWLNGNLSLLSRLKEDYEKGFIGVAKNFKK